VQTIFFAWQEKNKMEVGLIGLETTLTALGILPNVAEWLERHPEDTEHSTQKISRWKYPVS